MLKPRGRIIIARRLMVGRMVCRLSRDGCFGGDEPFRSFGWRKTARAGQGSMAIRMAVLVTSHWA